MDHKEQPKQRQQSNGQRQPYEAPRLQIVELLPEETLGIGCKTMSEPSCTVGFNTGS